MALQGQVPRSDTYHATQRIDGLAKVTGQKIFARDYHARDVWPDQNVQWYALYLRAIRTDMAFDGLTLDILPDVVPTRVVYGDQIAAPLNAPKVLHSRDQSLEEEADFDRPDGYLFDLVVRRGNAPDFLGQAVALLLFDSAAAYRKARAALQFQDHLVQVYGTVLKAGAPAYYDPKTLYVRVADPAGGPDLISYATAQSDEAYQARAPEYQALIREFIDTTPGLIVQDIDCAMQAMDPVFMEPEAGLAWYQKDAQKMSLVLGTQSPDGDARNVASMFGDIGAPGPVTHVDLKSCYPGGGFGGRDSSPFTLMTALAAAYSDGIPVRLEYDRFEQFRVGLKRHPARLKGRLAVDGAMKMRALQMDIVMDGGGRKNLSPYVAQLAALSSGNCYDVPMNDIAAQADFSTNVPSGSQRGFGGPQAFFATETALDQIARDQNWSPFAIRRANLATDGDQTVIGGPVEPGLRLRKLLDMAEAHPLWTNRRTLRDDFERRGQAYGTGLAMSLLAYGTSGDGVVAAVHLTDGGVAVRTDAVDMGNGSATTLATVVAEWLGQPAGKIAMGDYGLFDQTQLSDARDGSWDDPQWTAKGVGSSSASMTGFFQVHVAKGAARALFLNSVLPAARAIWGIAVSEGDTTWQLGRLTGPPAAEPLSVERLRARIIAMGLPTGCLAHAYFQQTWAQGDYALTLGTTTLPLDGVAFYADGADTPVPLWRTNTVGTPVAAQRYSRTVYCPSVNLIGVSVDPATGTPRVENAVTFLDAGKVHVEQLVSGQSQGGLAMAIGYTLMEDMPPGMDGPAAGDWNLNRYHVPRVTDVPLSDRSGPGQRLQELVLVRDSGEQTGKGIAEAVMCAVAPAISNAIADATGHRFTSLPITAAKIRERMQS